MINKNYFNQSNCRSLFTKIEYIPIVYFLKPLESRILNVYCKVDEINYVNGFVSVTAYSYEHNEIEFFADIPFDDFSLYELPYLNYDLNLTITFGVGDFIGFKNNSYYIVEDTRIAIEPLLRNYNYYESAIQKQVKRFNKVFGND